MSHLSFAYTVLECESWRRLVRPSGQGFRGREPTAQPALWVDDAPVAGKSVGPVNFIIYW